MDFEEIANKINWGWDASLEGDEAKDFVFLQLYKYFYNNGKVDDLGTDEQGSSTNFDWKMMTTMKAGSIANEPLGIGQLIRLWYIRKSIINKRI